METAPAPPLREAQDDKVFQDLKAGLDIRAGGRIVAACSDALSTGFEALNAALGGGFPRGRIASLEGPPSSGRTTLLAAALAEATQHALAAIVDDGSLYPPDLERAGVRLDRVLIVSAQAPLEIGRCTDIILRSRAFAVVAMPAIPLRATVWSRLCGLAQKAGAVLLTLGVHANTDLAYFASTRVRCAIEQVLWSGQSGVLSELAGYDVCAHVIKARRSAPGATARLQVVDRTRGVCDAALRSRACISPLRSAPRLRTGSA